MKFLGLDKVLVLCPHPDDAEISVSGTIMKYTDTEFHVLFMSQGTVADPSTGRFRMEESKVFWNKVDIDNFFIHYPPNNTYKEFNFDNTRDSEWIGAIEKVFDMSQFGAILATSDDDSHYEHVITNRVMKSIGRANPIALIEYRSPSSLHTWVPNLFVELTQDQIDLKLHGISVAFTSQKDAGYFTKECMEDFNKDYISLKKGVRFTEQFKVLNLYV